MATSPVEEDDKYQTSSEHEDAADSQHAVLQYPSHVQQLNHLRFELVTSVFTNHHALHIALHNRVFNNSWNAIARQNMHGLHALNTAHT